MKIIYNGTGTVRIERVGEVASGHMIEVPDKIAKALIAQNPKEWAPTRGALHETGGQLKPDRTAPPRVRREK